jgi:hypothetical protein
MKAGMVSVRTLSPELMTRETVIGDTPADVRARVLAFDDEAGSIAYVDAKGFPARIDFRQGVASTRPREGRVPQARPDREQPPDHEQPLQGDQPPDDF